MNIWQKVFTRVHASVLSITRGGLGSKMGRQSALLLHHVGRKSGKEYITTLSYYRDGNNYLIVSSNWGEEKHSDWFYNLKQRPRTSIQVGPKVIEVEAREASGEEYARLWQLVTRKNNQYIKYQAGMQRRIPILILSPINQKDKHSQ